MKTQTHLTKMVQGKHQFPAPMLWKQLTPQRQKHLAKHWARLIRQMQAHPDREKEGQGVEN